MIKENLSYRLNQLIESKFPDKTFIHVVRKHGFNYDSLRKIKEGKSPLGMKTLLQFIEIVPDTNLNWLFFNEGNMLRTETTLDTINHGLSPKNTREIISEMETVLKKYESLGTD